MLSLFSCIFFIFHVTFGNNNTTEELVFSQYIFFLFGKLIFMTVVFTTET